MDMTAILVMSPRPFEQTFVPQFHRSSIWNLILFRPVVSEEKMCRVWTTTDRRHTGEAYLADKLTNEPLAQVS